MSSRLHGPVRPDELKFYMNVLHLEHLSSRGIKGVTGVRMFRTLPLKPQSDFDNSIKIIFA